MISLVSENSKKKKKEFAYLSTKLMSQGSLQQGAQILGKLCYANHPMKCRGDRGRKEFAFEGNNEVSPSIPSFWHFDMSFLK